MNWTKYIGNGFLLLGMSCLSFTVGAGDKERMYVGLDAYYLSSSIGSDVSGEADFNPTAAGLRFGYYLEPQVSVEIFGALGAGDDEDLGIDLSAESVAGIVGRFETPETEDGAKLFLSLGYGMSELEMERSASSTPDRELYHGFVYGGGAEIRLGDSNSYINIQGLRYYDEDDISIDGISVGFRQGF